MALWSIPATTLLQTTPTHARCGPRKLASVGPVAGPELKVFRDPPVDVTECKPREEGHVCVRGACATKGYEFKPAHMAQDPNIEAMTSDGWLCTGDKGWLDEEGYLYLSGRFKEIINRGGEKLSPFEIEDVLLRHPVSDNTHSRHAITVTHTFVYVHRPCRISLRLRCLTSFSERWLVSHW